MQFFKKMNIYAHHFQDSTFFKKISERLLMSSLHPVYFSTVQHFIALSLFQFLMTSSKFVEHFPGSNKHRFSYVTVKQMASVNY